MKHLYIWLVVSTPLKNMKASWDDYFQYVYRKITNVPNYQPDRYIYIYILFSFYFGDLPLLCQKNTGGEQFPEGFPSDAEFKWCSVVFLDFPHLFYFASNDAAFLEQRFSNPVEKWRLL